MKEKKATAKSATASAKKVKKNDVLKADENQQNHTIVEEKPFDFGGIPDRNLKKNLGCG